MIRCFVMLFLWRPATYSWGDHDNFDKRANHDGFTNKISFTYQCKKIVLKPLSPQKVCEDQRKMREKILQEKREKEKETQTLESSKCEDKKRETQ